MCPFNAREAYGFAVDKMIMRIKLNMKCMEYTTCTNTINARALPKRCM